MERLEALVDQPVRGDNVILRERGAAQLVQHTRDPCPIAQTAMNREAGFVVFFCRGIISQVLREIARGVPRTLSLGSLSQSVLGQASASRYFRSRWPNPGVFCAFGWLAPDRALGPRIAPTIARMRRSGVGHCVG